MKWPQGVLIVISVVLTLGLLGVQIWAWERQLDRQKAAIALQKAHLELWQAQANARPGQPMAPMPPIVTQPPVFFPWFLWFFPLAMVPSLLAAEAERQRLQKLQHQEEEDQSPYSEEDLMENWEFKIIRCPIPLFGQPAFLERVLREEALAGWQLVEKFDCTRVRLKRVAGRPPVADLPAGYDPYRTQVGPKAKWHVVLWIFCILCLILVPVFIVKQIFEPMSAPAFWVSLAVPACGALVLGVLAIRAAAKYRKQAHLA